MKKKLLWVLGIVVLVILGIVGYFVVSDLNQEAKLKEELDGLNELVNADNMDLDLIYERLDRTVTKGDYAKVEESFKNYLKDNFDNSVVIVNILNDERITTSLTVTNYQEDGPDFIETKEYLTTTKAQLEGCLTKYKEFLTYDKAMSYIEDKDLDSYYIDLYKDEYVGDIDNALTEDDLMVSSVNEIIELLNNTEHVIDFLIANKGSWNVEGENINFNTNALADQYDVLLNKLS